MDGTFNALLNLTRVSKNKAAEIASIVKESREERDTRDARIIEAELARQRRLFVANYENHKADYLSGIWLNDSYWYIYTATPFMKNTPVSDAVRKMARETFMKEVELLSVPHENRIEGDHYFEIPLVEGYQRAPKTSQQGSAQQGCAQQ
jgi:hypothetical protein